MGVDAPADRAWPAPNRKDSLLWKVEDSSSHAPSFLFGTMHVKDQRAFRWMTVAREALSECDALALEFDLGQAPSVGQIARLKLPGNQSLERMLGKRKFEKYRKILLKAFGLDLGWFNYAPPMLAMQAIDASILNREQPVALDQALFELAGAMGKPVYGLETPESQLALFESIPVAYQLQQLVKLARRVRAHRRALLRYAELYQEGRVRDIYQAARQGAGGLRDILVYRRNRVMADRMLELMREGSVFAAVGAGHLPGEKGMLRFLKKAGCRITPQKGPP